MCELLGMSANIPTDICFSFSGLMQRGGKTGPHKDGWGVAFYEGRGCRTFHDPFPSSNSEIAKFIKHYPINSRNVICHIRKANRGKVCLENTHPFVRELWGRNWCFAHNGQLKGIKKKLSLEHFEPVGTTDSEHAFCWIMDNIYKKFPKPPQKDQSLAVFIAKLCQTLAEFGVFNILMCDSKYLYAHCSTKLVWITRKAPFGKAKLVDDDMTVDFHQQTTPKDVFTIIATAPLTENEDWHRAQKGDFLVFKDGQRKIFK
ncbi:MAG: class II glutamine amidotransferase [Gammaproteobacteria bacterium 39-13]|nr:class II glutamine amidotransferase [Gammaproteobacteria bacterium]OJV89024.1 MAG: class II glutamine amidotransferase [Gammaproteobacteria bacterium 39-13]